MTTKDNLLNNSLTHPIDLLPIVRPLDSTNYPDETFFYQNVVCKLIPDIIRMETNGIPINLDKVSGVEETVNNALENVYSQIAKSPLMLKYLESENAASIYYSLTELNADNYLDAATDLIEIKNAGEHVVYYYIVADSNHEDVAGELSVSISKAELDGL